MARQWLYLQVGIIKGIYFLKYYIVILNVCTITVFVQNKFYFTYLPLKKNWKTKINAHLTNKYIIHFSHVRNLLPYTYRVLNFTVNRGNGIVIISSNICKNILYTRYFGLKQHKIETGNFRMCCIVFFYARHAHKFINFWIRWTSFAGLKISS